MLTPSNDEKARKFIEWIELQERIVIIKKGAVLINCRLDELAAN